MAGDTGPTNSRELAGRLRAVAETVWFPIIALGVVAAFELPSYFGQTFFREQYLALFPGLVLFVAFLAFGPVKRTRPSRPVPAFAPAAGIQRRSSIEGSTMPDTAQPGGDTVLVEIEGGIARVTLNRPGLGNYKRDA